MMPSSPSLQIRTVEHAVSPILLQQLTDIYLECFNAAPRSENWQREEVVAMLAHKVQLGATITIAEADGQPAGFALGLPVAASSIAEDLCAVGVNKEDYYLDQIAISGHHQGAGIGKALLAQQIEVCAARHTGIAVRCRADMQPIQKLLTAQQFQVIARYVTHVAQSAPAERLILKKHLN